MEHTTKLTAKPTEMVQLKDKPDNPWKSTLRTLFRNRSAVMGMSIIATLILIAIFAPVIATHDPLLSMIGIPGEVPPFPRKPPCIPLFGCEEPLHILGLDLNGRDLFSRIVYGARVSLFVGMTAVTFAISIGTVLGLVSGYAGGWVDNVIMRFMDVMLAFPGLLLAITIVTIRGPGLENALFAIAIVTVPVYARLTRASVLSVKELEYITAERALGANHFRIIFRHMIPATLSQIIVVSTLSMPAMIIAQTALSFLGLGLRPPVTS